MLQQTTVETVIPYYERFLKRFPDVRSLAAAEEEEVLRYWSGLGYYSRARNLLKAAKAIIKRGEEYRRGGSEEPTRPLADRRHDAYDDSTVERERASGRNRERRVSRQVTKNRPADIPLTAAEWQQLPGIGRYTAGAIASIAFGERVPVVDGNVIRVLSRLFAIKTDPQSTRGRKVFWSKAEEILTVEDCGGFNQALMELGATVCTPTAPDCRVCPLAGCCDARQEGRPEFYPQGKRKVSYRDVRLAAAIVRKNGKLLMVRRPDHGLLKGMWEFPMVEGDVNHLARRFAVTPVRALSPVRHSVLNRRLVITPYLCRPKSNLLADGRVRWVPICEMDRLPTSSMNRKLLQGNGATFQ